MRSVGTRALAGIMVAAAALFAAAPSALAANPRAGTGTVQLGPPTLIWQSTIGANLIRQEDGSLTFTGTIAATGSLNVLALVHPPGNETFFGDWSAPATVNGTSGTLTLAVIGRDNGVSSGTFLALGSGGLAGLHGQGNFSVQDATGMGTYSFHWNT